MWRLLQLVDSAFPTGGFVHSGGLEAALRSRAYQGVRQFAELSLGQWGTGLLPFVGAVCRAPSRHADLDRELDAAMLSDVQRVASRAQGRALVRAVAEAFGPEGCPVAPGLPTHFATTWGLALGLAGASPEVAAETFVFSSLRALYSAAVRLSALGPYEAEREKAALEPLARKAIAEGLALAPSDAFSSAPLVDLTASLHRSLDARLFQS